ncbi:MAG: ROK family glucokinase [Coprococcus sp.]
MDKYCFGVDLGGTTVKMGLFTVTGELLDKWEIPTRTENHGEYILGDIAASIQAKMSEKQLTDKNVTGVGIGVPGPVIKESIVQQCVNLGWGTVNVAETLASLTHLPVKAANDANVAALGEQWQGGGKGYDSLIMMTLGTGVGGGIISDGKIVSGANGAAGEIGHMVIVDPADITGVCGCGHVGCLEQAASATGLVNMTRKLLTETDESSSLRGMDPLTAKDILDAAKAGDDLAVRAADKMMMYLGRAAAYLACAMNPDIFVIGGGVSRAGSYLTDGIRKYYRETVFHASTETPFVLATLGNDAGIIGAAKLVCDMID